MRHNLDMRSPAPSSIRVSAQTRRRVGALAARLKLASQQEVIDRALDELEHRLFWDGFEEDARAYRKAFPEEDQERARYAGTSGDGLIAGLVPSHATKTAC
jgi:hypothetical protein